MREGNWKLLCMEDGSSPELYDLGKDQGEKTNLAGTEPGRVGAMRKRLLAWNAGMPKDRPSSRVSLPNAAPKVEG